MDGQFEDWLVLGLESSCDETGVGIVSGNKHLHADIIWSQAETHAAFGGVVPEVAARAHAERLDLAIKAALQESKVALCDLDAIAATLGPGLIGGVMVGAVTGKALALALGKPFIAVNHLEGHALSVRLTGEVPFPYLLLLISGGHCQLLLVRGVGDYKRLGTTLDDSVGETFDKGAKLLGLGYPGGPEIERLALEGDAAHYPLPRPMKGRAGADFSFSGLKTALRRQVELIGATDKLAPEITADLAAGLQAAIIDCLVDRSRHAMDMVNDMALGIDNMPFVVAGGVAANSAIRQALSGLAAKRGYRFVAPPPRLCTDNGVMIAWAGLERLRLGLEDPLDAPVRARWPLDVEAPAKVGSGRKGAKA